MINFGLIMFGGLIGMRLCKRKEMMYVGVEAIFLELDI
jgi:hypothetical protein